MRRFVAGFALLTSLVVVLACGGGGIPGVSIPQAPTNLVGLPGDGQAILTWNVSSGATHYNVKRSLTPSGPYTLVAGPTLPAYTDTGLTNGTPYYYVVSADSAMGESQNSLEVAVTPVGAPAPVDVSIGANFSPVTVQAKRGQQVRWTNNDLGVHTITGDTADGPDSGAGGLSNGQQFAWTVPAGAAIGHKYYYHCLFHGSSGGGNTLGLGMAGAIEVIP